MINEAPSISGNTKSLMVLMHGLGSNGDDLFSLVPFLQKDLPDTHFYSPDGIENCDMFPFGYQWFSLQNRDDEALRAELVRVEQKIRDLIEKKAKSLDLQSEDIILLGFSQGTMTALYLSLTANQPYRAVIGFSGALIEPENISNKNTPVFLIHGAKDDVVAFESMESASQRLKNDGIKVSTLAIPNLAHSIDMSGIERAISFIKEEA